MLSNLLDGCRDVGSLVALLKLKALPDTALPIYPVCSPSLPLGRDSQNLKDTPVTHAATLADAIGRTPLIKLRRASDETGCTILGKAELMNPVQSVKDRAALFLIEDALKRKAVAPGGVIVEGTAGNTGIGLAALSRAFGLRAVIVMPDTQSVEKKDAVRALGALLVEVPAVAYANPNNYVHYSRRLAEALAQKEPGGAVWANQFDNVANRDGHARTTAEEIWAQTDGRIDGFVSAVGTGGTLAGVALGLRQRSKTVKIALADPPGAALHAFYTRGVLEARGSSITEGIGQSRITKNLEGFAPDFSFEVPDTDSIPLVHRLIVEEGLCVGGSSGVNIAGAIQLARELGPGHTIVTMLCDHGTRYQSKILNPDFLASKDLPVPDWLKDTSRSLPEVFTT